MPKLNFSRVAAIAAVAALTGAGVATADILTGPSVHNASNDGRDVHQVVAASDGALLKAFSTFGDPGSVASAAEQQRLRDAFGGDSTSANGPVAHADFSVARTAAVRGSSKKAYLVPSGDRLCIVAPDPEDGYGATCQTLADVKAGEGVIELSPRRDSTSTTVVVAVAVPEGGAAPTLISRSGAKTKLAVDGNVAATVATVGDQLALPNGTIQLSS